MGIFSDIAGAWDNMQNPFYPVSPDVLFQAAVSAGGRLSWTVEHADGSSRTLTFVAHKDHLIADYSEGLFSVFIVPEEVEGVSGARLRSAGRAGPADSIFEGVTNEFIAAVNGALIQMGYVKDGEFTNAGAPAPKSKPAPSAGKNPFAGGEPNPNSATGSNSPAVGLASELASLTDLHKSGALTDEEFSAAKKKLIG
jgi:hypothetical protein